MTLLKKQPEKQNELTKNERENDILELKSKMDNEIEWLIKEVKENEEKKKNNIRKFLIQCIINWEDPQEEELTASDNNETEDFTISAEEAEEERWVTRDFVDFIYDCESWLTEEQRKIFREDIKDIIIKLYTSTSTTEFLELLSKDLIDKWEPVLTNIKWFREKFNEFFEGS